MKEHAVIVAGGGPTGLMLAGELALAGIDVAIVERRATQDIPTSGALGINARTVELLDQRGILDRFLAVGKPMQTHGFGYLPIDISDLPTRHNYGLAIGQAHIERHLAEWVRECGVPTYRLLEVTDFRASDAHVDVELSDGSRMRAQYLCGCDGGRSAVRRIAGIDFPGWDASTSWINAEVATSEEPKWGFFTDASGVQHAIGKSENGSVRMVLTEPNAGRTREPSLDELRALLVSIYGTDFGVHSPRWISYFTDATRQAATYRKGRVLLAGDAANVRPPIGGQGLNLGVQDAVNLGWKLAQVVKGESPDALLDSYHAERHPAVLRVLRNVMAQVAFRRADERSRALAEVFADLLKSDDARRRLGALLAGLDVRYDLGERHPLVGRRMPDLDLISADGQVRVFSFLHEATPVLFSFQSTGGLDIGAWTDRVQHVEASYAGRWELPVIGVVDAPTAVLVRPDGHVAWVGMPGEGEQPGLTEALRRWFGEG